LADKKKSYTVRYDRIFGALGLFLCFVLLVSGMTSCMKRIKENKNPETSGLSSDVSTEQTEQQLKNYPSVSIETEKIHSGILILVNQAFPCLFDKTAVENGTSSDISFVTIKSILDTKTSAVKPYTASDWEVGLDRVAALAMDDWFEDFYEQSGHNDLRMIGGYKPEATDPDFETGRTLTVGIFPETGSSYAYKPEGDYTWLAEHAADYGFVLRYPEGKENYFDETVTERRTATFRYVGLPAAAYMRENGLCLEEFLQEIKAYRIDNMLNITAGGKTYSMYYTQANTADTVTNFYLPSDDASYDVSGNNMDGFIITIYE